MKSKSYLVRQGRFIRELRKGIGLTQLQLCGELSPENYICSEKTLRRIERGKTDPDLDILAKLMFALGSSIEELKRLVPDDMTLFNADFTHIWDVAYDEDYEEMGRLLQALKNKEYCDPSDPTMLQTLLLCEGIFLSGLNKQDHSNLDILYRALRITNKHILAKDNKINFDVLQNQILSISEYRILNVVAVIKRDLGATQESIAIQHATLASLENKRTSYETQKKLLPIAYFNFSNRLLDGEFYTDALKIVERGIMFCNKTKEFRVLGELLCNKGKALWFLNDKQQAAILFQQSYDFFMSHQNSNSANLLKNGVKTEFKIIIG